MRLVLLYPGSNSTLPSTKNTFLRDELLISLNVSSSVALAGRP